MGCGAILIGHNKNHLQGESYRYPLLSFSTSLQKRVPRRIQTAATAIVRKGRAFIRTFGRHALSRYCCFRGKTKHKRTPRCQHPRFALLFESSLYHIDLQASFRLGAKRNETWLYMLCSFLLCKHSYEGSFVTLYVIFPLPPVHFLRRILSIIMHYMPFAGMFQELRVTYPLSNRIP